MGELAFAGGEWVRSFAIITTTPNELCAELHNRMPVVLKSETWRVWLGEDPADGSSLKALMPRLAPLPREATTGLDEILRASEGRMGFVPNSQLIIARRPEILRAFAQLGAAINGPSSTISPQLRNMVSQMASRAAGCGYCMAHTAHTAERVGIAAEKENALWEFETSPLFSAAERAALRVAHGAAQVPTR